MLKKVKVNIDQFVLDTRKREFMWNIKRRHPVFYLINRFQWYQYPKSSYVRAFPLHVDFEASARCNMACPMCFRRYLKRKNFGDMDFELYKRLIDECAKNKLYSIRVSWRGEPTVNPYLIEMIRYAKEKGIKEVSFLTNGLKLEHEYSKELVSAGLDYISVSIDGINEEYEKLRKPAKFDATVERIRELKALRDKFGGGYPRIKVNTIWSAVKNNIKEFKKIFEPITDVISFNPNYDYSEEEIRHDPDFICQYPWQRITIMWDGKVPMCISDWQGDLIIGDVNEQSIKEIWLGEKMQDIRRRHLEKNRLSLLPCKQCHRPVTEQIGNVRET